MVGTFAGNVSFGAAGTFQSNGQRDAFVATFPVDGVGSVGSARWARAYGASSEDIVHAVARDADGAVVAVGEFVGAVDFGDGSQQASAQDAFVLKLDVDGDHVWSGVYGGPSRDAALRVCVDVDDRVIVGGEFEQWIRFQPDKQLESNGLADIFVAKFPPNPNSLVQP